MEAMAVERRTGTRGERVVDASFNGLEVMLRAILAPMGILVLKTIQQ